MDLKVHASLGYSDLESCAPEVWLSPTKPSILKPSRLSSLVLRECRLRDVFLSHATASAVH